jgi:hypothetical protein
MKNHIGTFALLLPLALAGAGSALAAEDDAATCSVATLHGRYLFSYQGVTITGAAADKGPFAVAGFEVFDGKGNVRGFFTVSVNGKITRRVLSTGTYTVNSNCIGFASYSDGTHEDQYLAPDGSSFVFIQVDTGTVATGFEPRATARRVDD